MKCFFQWCEPFLKALRFWGTTFLSGRMLLLLSSVVLGLSTPLSQAWAVSSDQNQYLAESENLQLDFLAEELLEAGISIEELSGLFAGESLSFEEKLVMAEYLIKVGPTFDCHPMRFPCELELDPVPCKRSMIDCDPPPKPPKCGISEVLCDPPCERGIRTPGCEPEFEPDPFPCKLGKIDCDPPKPIRCIGDICPRSPVKKVISDRKFPEECACW